MFHQITKHESSTYDDPILSSYIERMHAEYYQRAILLGQTHAFKSSPPPATSNWTPYINTITANYNVLMVHNHATMQAHVETQTGSMDLDSAKKAEIENQDTINRLTTEIKINESRLSDASPILSFIKFGSGVILVASIGLAELYLIALAFQILGKGLGAALLFALGLCMAMIAITHLVPLLIARIRSHNIRKIASWATVTLIVILFVGLSIYRNEYVERSSGVHTSAFSTVWFVAWNIAMMVALYGINFM